MSRRKEADIKSAQATMKRLMREVASQPHAELPSVPEALEFRRGEYGLTQREFATVIGMGHTHYSEVVNGKRPLPRNALVRAYRIGVPADVLLSGTETESGEGQP